jgi:hypothetical protein
MFLLYIRTLMARNINNVITRNISGKLGQIVFLKNGVIRSRPDMSKRVLSEKQKAHLARFEQAKAYARAALADPELSKKYVAELTEWKKRHGNSSIGIWQLAIRDFMKRSTPGK